MYELIKKLLFCFPPETSHELALEWMGAAHRLGLLKLIYDTPQRPVSVMGLDFTNPIGLAAGLDKNGDYFNALGQLGFGFVEIGTVTPKAQPGNEKPRLFRLVEHQAIINRMGFNNYGLEHLVTNVKKRTYQGVLGINIGKNKLTAEENALTDYSLGLQAVYPYADYVTINISSPNTPGLRNLQFGEPLNQLLKGINTLSKQLAQQHEKSVPIAVKIAPDLSDDEIRTVADSLVENGISCVIATNTTVDKASVKGHLHCDEAGGLSGAPVAKQSTHVIRVLHDHLQGEIPIIGVGGILNAEDAVAKVEAGADLLQVYTGFIYRGPKLIEEAAGAFS